MKIIFKDSFPSYKKTIDDIINRLVAKINDSGITVEINIQEMHLAIDEAISNAMEHGNNWDPLIKVHVIAKYKSPYLYISIQDEGSGFDVINTKDTTITDKLALRGYGIKIINAFCKPSWNDTGNHITLRFDVKD